ncbi:hypothetical protein [Croceicoccus sp. YJ47]|uniref:hypothetical protein n=1 Tax=Croceicoccus sp. YJ47 TaxID=2798724 RepID=UPI00192327E2|nr:hypothetical protein [Croceicoccus sp. YJ47]QQN73926.1 hypothetical protein JD971_14445 [Croceicoccus sp. YJ47]
MTYTLTDAERDTINAAAAIIDKHTPPKSSWQVGFNRYDEFFGVGVTYFDSRDCDHGSRQHSFVQGKTLADKVQSVIKIEASVVHNKEANRLASIDSLRKQLAALTGEAA